MTTKPKPKWLMTAAEKEWALHQEYWQQQRSIQNSTSNSRFDYTKDFQDRPARKQVDQPRSLQQEDISGFYNIWYHRIYGENSWDKNKRDRAESRCNVEKDAGRTRGDSKTTHICIYFCKGRCSQGPNCNYLHRRPLEFDEKRTGTMHDIFGRERFSSERDDMSGVGCFFHDNKTLYIGSLKNTGTVEEMEELVRRHFEEWGELDYVRVIKSKAIAFVQYKLRCCAEFAKEAMSDQSLGYNEILNVRWAHDDPNPNVQIEKESKASEQVLETMVDKWGSTALWEYKTEQYLQTGELPSEGTYQYPNTDAQYAHADYYNSYGAAMNNNPAYPFHYFQQYDQSAYYQPYTTPYKTVEDLRAEREREENEVEEPSQKKQRITAEEDDAEKETNQDDTSSTSSTTSTTSTTTTSDSHQTHQTQQLTAKESESEEGKEVEDQRQTKEES